jgi:hypothetical protein
MDSVNAVNAIEAAELAYGQALDHLYATFARYPFRRDMPCCIPHCMDREQLDVWNSRPIRTLTIEEINPFASNLSTCGETEDFKFVLPRIFEASAEFAFMWPDPPVAFSNLLNDDWHTWPTGERGAIMAFLEAWWMRHLTSKSEQIEDCFVALCVVGTPIRHWMQMWRETEPISLAQFVLDHASALWLGHGISSFHNKALVVPALLAFFSEPETAEAFETAFLAATHLETQDLLSTAEGLVRT